MAEINMGMINFTATMYVEDLAGANSKSNKLYTHHYAP